MGENTRDNKIEDKPLVTTIESIVVTPVPVITEEPQKKGRNKGWDNLQPIKKGERRNPTGRPKGQRDYKTIYREALIKIGNANGKTPEEIEEMMEEVGLKNAMKGNFQFWKDIRDRVHGKAPEKSVSVVINNELPLEVKDLTKKLNDLYRGTGGSGNGEPSSPVGSEAPHKE